tara:strand:- start:5608 stop:7323 length:1716 start_codon:yes stop_codon:yes gene_type:complete
MKKLYLFIILLFPAFIYGQTTDLIITKWGEGSSNNKFIEIYNGTGNDLDLSDYSISTCSNGCDTADEWDYPDNITFDAGTIISHGDVYVITHPSADAGIASDQTFTYLSNGDDAFALTLAGATASEYTIIDILGDMQGDPGDGWDVAGVSEATKNHTLTRKSSVCSPNPTPWGSSNDTNDSAGTNEEDSEWIVTDQNSGWETVGSFSSDCVDDISLTITSPQDGFTYSAGTTVATINFTVSNFNVGASGDDDVDGHVHMSVNGEMTGGPSGDGMLYNVDPVELAVECGVEYTVNISLADEAHQPLDPAVETSVTFSVLCANCTEEGSIIITEILNNATGDDDSKEWFEVYNTSTSDIDMENWIISDEGSNSFTINGSLIVPAQGYLVLGEETDTSINGGAPVDYAWGTETNFTLGNGDDEVIISCGGNIIDMVAYDNGDTFPDESGYSMQLLPDAYTSSDNDDGTNWVASASTYGDNGDYGTPGQEPQMGLTDVLLDGFKIYPNPVNSGTFEIMLTNNQDASFKIFNILGEIIIDGNSILQPIKIDNVQSGIYLIEVSNNNQSIVKKLIVN